MADVPKGGDRKAHRLPKGAYARAELLAEAKEWLAHQGPVTPGLVPWAKRAIALVARLVSALEEFEQTERDIRARVCRDY